MFRVSEINEIQLRRVSTQSSVALITLLLFGVSLLGFAPKAHAQSEDQVMAAFLLNFARYVEWPKDAFETPDSPVSICVVGAVAFSDVVSRTVSGKTVEDRRVAVHAISQFDQFADCHILFIGRSFKKTHVESVPALQGLSVFSVADREGFAAAGGVANFFRAKSRIHFAINPVAANKSGLKISSRLLRLAKVVK